MKKKRKIITKDGKNYTIRGVELTRASGTKTESEFLSMFKNALRILNLRWRPRKDYLDSKRRIYKGKSKGIKYEYPCEVCNKWFPERIVYNKKNKKIKKLDVQADHIIPCGGLPSLKVLGEVAERMFIEVDGGWQSLCKECHKTKTNNERQKRNKK